MGQAQRTIRVLLIGKRGDSELSAPDWLGPSVDIVRVESADEARALIAETSFDYVISSPDTLRVEAPSPADHRGASEREPEDEGVGVVDRAGGLAQVNARLAGFSDEVHSFVRQACTDALARCEEDDSGEEARHLVEARATLRATDGALYEMTVTPVLESGGRIDQVVAVVRDVTRVKARRERLAAIGEAGRELLRLNAEQVSQLAMPERLAFLEQKIIRYLHDLMRFDNFSIHLLDKKTNKLEPVLLSGMPTTVRTIDLYAHPEGNGIAGFVAFHGKTYICPDVSKDSHYFKGLEGARSSLTVPLRLNDEVIGILNVESNELAAFDSEQSEMAEILGHDIATALHILDLLVTERYTATGQIGSDVMAEVTEPLNDILTDVENLVEDYIGHDDLRHRLNKITSNAVAIRESIKRVTSPKRGLVGHRPTGVRRTDPILTGKRLLVTDDEQMIRETVRDVLASYGCEVSVAKDGDDAADLIGKNAFDLVLSDIKMPGRNGYEVFAAAKEANPDTPVILMTGFGYDPNHSIVRARREGLAAVLFKPFKVDQLLGEIRAALHTPAD